MALNPATLAALIKSFTGNLAKASTGGAAPGDPFSPELGRQVAALSAAALSRPGAQPVHDVAAPDAPDPDTPDPASTDAGG